MVKSTINSFFFVDFFCAIILGFFFVGIILFYGFVFWTNIMYFCQKIGIIINQHTQNNCTKLDCVDNLCLWRLMIWVCQIDKGYMFISVSLSLLSETKPRFLHFNLLSLSTQIWMRKMKFGDIWVMKMILKSGNGVLEVRKWRIIKKKKSSMSHIFTKLSIKYLAMKH